MQQQNKDHTAVKLLKHAWLIQIQVPVAIVVSTAAVRHSKDSTIGVRRMHDIASWLKSTHLPSEAGLNSAFAGLITVPSGQGHACCLSMFNPKPSVAQMLKLFLTKQH
jgi:hypothetical protein